MATNIAKASSLTIDGIYYVVDLGFAKQNTILTYGWLDSLAITPISQESTKTTTWRIELEQKNHIVFILKVPMRIRCYHNYT